MTVPVTQSAKIDMTAPVTQSNKDGKMYAFLTISDGARTRLLKIELVHELVQL